jgi:ribosome-associated protein
MQTETNPTLAQQVDRQTMKSEETKASSSAPSATRPADLARAADLLAERKAQNLLLMDLRGLSNATDYFLLASGTSDLHARSIAEHVIEELKKDGVRPDHVEGLRGGRWVLIDYIDFVVHVFHPAAREFYQLERLWGDAPVHVLET